MGSREFDQHYNATKMLVHNHNIYSRLTRGSFSDILIQLGIGVGLSAGTLLLFSVLRRKNGIVYMPRRPPELGVAFLSGLRPLIHTSENELLENLGLDAVIFLRLLKMCRWMCGLLALLACFLLIPCDLFHNIQRFNSDAEYDIQGSYLPLGKNQLLLVNAVTIKGTWLYPHILYGYVGTWIVLYVIYFNYKSVLSLKWKWFRSPGYQRSILARSVMLTHVDSQYMSDTGLQQLFTQLQAPFAATAVYFGRRVGILSFLIQCHNQNVCNLEEALVTYLKGGNVSRKRPMIRVHEDIQCMWGKKVDAIDFHTKKIKQYKREIEKECQAISHYQPESYAFASFATVAHAHMVAKELDAKKIRGASISLASPPQDIIWDNLTKPRWIIWCRWILARIVIFVFGIVYTVPLAFIVFLAILIFDPVLLKSLASSEYSNYSWVVIFGVVPPLLSLLCQLAPLAVLRGLGKFEGPITHQQLERTVFSGYFFFLAAFHFLIFSGLGSVIILATISKAKKVGPDDLVIILEIYLIESNYWLTWFPLRIFTASLKLVQIFSLISSIRFKLWKTNRTPREIRELTKPSDFDYPVHMANILLMLLVALIYAPLAPLVTLLATGVFYAISWIYKYQLMYLSATKCESGGRMWRMLINRILFSLIVMQIFLFCTTLVQSGWVQSIAVLPLLAMVIAFKFFLKSNFDSKFRWYIPTGKEFIELKHHCDDAQQNGLVKQFGHPLLHEELLTPMIHKNHQKFLAQVYSARPTDTTEDEEDPLTLASASEINYLGTQDSRTGFQTAPTGEQQVDVGGLQFSVISKDNLMYSHTAFLRERGGAKTSFSFPLTADEHVNHTNHFSDTTLEGGFNLYSRSNNDIRPDYLKEEAEEHDLSTPLNTMHEYPPEFGGYAMSPYEPPHSA